MQKFEGSGRSIVAEIIFVEKKRKINDSSYFLVIFGIKFYE